MQSSQGASAASSSSALAIEDRASHGMRAFLTGLPPEDLKAIARTSTGGLIATNSTEEAISIICKYSDAVSLLNRRKITREIMAKYLHSEKVHISLPADKTKLCRYVLAHWGISASQTRTYNFKEYPAPPNSPVQMRRVSSSSTAFLQNGLPTNAQASIYSQSAPAAASALSVSMTTTTTGYGYHDDRMDDDPMEMSTDVYYPDSGSHAHAPQPPQQQQQQTQTGQQLAEQFAPWFYNMWNTLTDFEPHHFWAQCNLRVDLIRPDHDPGSAPETREFCSGPEACAFLKHLVLSEQLFMNPNLLEGLGVWGKVNPHGLAQVIVCGTVHKAGLSFGIFEQVFGLVKDPACENNFKIQYTVLRLKGMAMAGILAAPTIRDTSLGCMIEELSDE